MSYRLTGRCGCGAVRYELTSPLVSAGYCHCHRCQRRTGTGASANGQVEPGSFRLVTGEERLRAWRPENGWEKWFCGDCGSAVFSRHPDDPLRIGIRLGTLDSDPGIRPSYHQFMESAAPWDSVRDSLQQYPEGRPTG